MATKLLCIYRGALIRLRALKEISLLPQHPVLSPDKTHHTSDMLLCSDYSGQSGVTCTRAAYYAVTALVRVVSREYGQRTCICRR